MWVIRAHGIVGCFEIGYGGFVESVSKKAQEQLERSGSLEAAGFDFNWLVRPVVETFNMEPENVLKPGKYPHTVKARGVLCCWGVREMGMTTVGDVPNTAG